MPKSTKSQPAKRSNLAALAILGGILGLYVLEKIIGVDLFFCPFHKITGLYCPGCGVTRMVESILQLDFCRAFRFNPLVFCLLPVFIINFLMKRLCGKDFLNNHIIIYIILGAVLMFGVLRNFPAFDFLAPTDIR